MIEEVERSDGTTVMGSAEGAENRTEKRSKLRHWSVRPQKCCCWRGTVLAKNSSARRGARRKSAGETGDEGMIASLLCHLALRISDVIRQLAGEIVYSLNDFVGIEPDVLGHLAPVAGLNVTEAIFSTELHGEFRFFDIDLRVGQDARHVVEGREACPALRSNE